VPRADTENAGKAYQPSFRHARGVSRSSACGAVHWPGRSSAQGRGWRHATVRSCR